VQTDVGGVKTDLTKTQSDLANTISQLQSVRGDLSSTTASSPAITTSWWPWRTKATQLLRVHPHQGERKPVGTVSLELKKVDGRESLHPDGLLRRQGRAEAESQLDEPMQFYSGKDPALYEVVVNAINSKNQISGYLSVPRACPCRLPLSNGTWGATVRGAGTGIRRYSPSSCARPLLLVIMNAETKVPSTVWPGPIVVSSAEMAPNAHGNLR